MSEIIEFEGRQYEPTGLDRPPREGEVFAGIANPVEAYRATCDYPQHPGANRRILRPVSAPPQPPAEDGNSYPYKCIQCFNPIATESEERLHGYFTCRSNRPNPQRLEQAGEPGEALKELAAKIVEAIWEKSTGTPTPITKSLIAEALAPLLKKARAAEEFLGSPAHVKLPAEVAEGAGAGAGAWAHNRSNQLKAELAAERARWETTPRAGMEPK